jgi:hypothetical protein
MPGLLVLASRLGGLHVLDEVGKPLIFFGEGMKLITSL